MEVDIYAVGHLPPFGSVIRVQKVSRSCSALCTRSLVDCGRVLDGCPTSRGRDQRRHRHDDPVASPAAAAAARVGRDADTAARSDVGGDRR